MPVNLPSWEISRRLAGVIQLLPSHWRAIWVQASALYFEGDDVPRAQGIL